MSDITERLRARPTFTPHDQDLLADAADAIESRDAAIAELRANLSAIETGDTAEILAMYRRIRDERDELNVAYAKAAIERDELRAQVEALRDQRPLSKSTRLDALRFRTLIDTSPGRLCFMGQDYRTAEEFRAAIDAYRSQEAAR